MSVSQYIQYSTFKLQHSLRRPGIRAQRTKHAPLSKSGFSRRGGKSITKYQVANTERKTLDSALFLQSPRRDGIFSLSHCEPRKGCAVSSGVMFNCQSANFATNRQNNGEIQDILYETVVLPYFFALMNRTINGNLSLLLFAHILKNSPKLQLHFGFLRNNYRNSNPTCTANLSQSPNVCTDYCYSVPFNRSNAAFIALSISTSFFPSGRTVITQGIP